MTVPPTIRDDVLRAHRAFSSSILTDAMARFAIGAWMDDILPLAPTWRVCGRVRTMAYGPRSGMRHAGHSLYTVAEMVEPGDVAALAQALSRVLADPRLRERLVAAGSRRADDFSMTALAQRYVAHYERLAATGLALHERPRGRRWSRMLNKAVVPRLARASAFIDRSSS